MPGLLWKHLLDSLPGNGPSGLHGLAVIEKPVDTAVDAAHPVLFRASGSGCSSAE